MRRHAIKINGHDTPVMKSEKYRNSDRMEHPCEGWVYDFAIETPDQEWRIPLALPNPLKSRGKRVLKPSDIEEIMTHNERPTEVMFRTGEKIQPLKEPVIRDLTNTQKVINRTILECEYVKNPGEYHSLYSPYIAVGDSPAVNLLTIGQAAEYARVDERTIRNWLKRCDGDKPMLPGAIKTGRLMRIPQADLDPWRKDVKAKRPPKKTSRKRAARKPVKRKS